MKKMLSLILIVTLLATFVVAVTANAASYGIQKQKITTISSEGQECSVAIDLNGYPHVTYRDGNRSGLYYGWWNGTAWSNQRIEDGGVTGLNGLYSTLKLDSNGYPHVCYFDADSSYYLYLRYAHWNGESWVTQTVDPQGEGRRASLALDSHNRPHISYYGGSSLKYASLTGASWNIETVDLGVLYSLSIGVYSSLQIDSNDTPHIAYCDETNYLLKYAKWNGSQWSIETVDSNSDRDIECSLALDSTNNPSISYRFNDGLRYAKHASLSWNIQTVDATGDPNYAVGVSPSMAIDSDGTPHVSYIDSYRSNVLKYASLNGSSWKIYGISDSYHGGYTVSLALDQNDNVHIVHNDYLGAQLEYMHFDPKTLGTPIPIPNPTPLPTPPPIINPASPIGTPKVVDPNSYSGMYTAIALDSFSNPHISFFDANVGLKHAACNGSIWRVEAVDVSGWYGRYTSIAVDQNGYPHISYFDNINSSLKYAYWNGLQWSTQTIDKGHVGSFSSIVLDGDGHPHISYFAVGAGALKYAEWNGYSWLIQTVDTALSPSDSYGEFSSLALDSSGKPHISYYDWRNGNLRYASWTGSTWNIQTIDAVGDVGYSTSLKLDANDKAHISYLDNTNLNLKYAHSTGSSWSIQTVDYVGNARSQDWLNQTSLALDENGYPHISYLDAARGNLDYAFWNGSIWVIQIADSAPNVGWSCSLALDSSGRAHISYFDNSNHNLRYIASVNASGFPTIKGAYTPPTPTPTPTPIPTNSPTSTAAPQPTATPTATPSPNTPMAILDFTCKSQSTAEGFSLQTQGQLTADDNGIPNAEIVLSYSVNAGKTWSNLALAKTNDTGQFYTQTKLFATGVYLVNAMWSGNQTYPSASKTVNFAVMPLEKENLLSITSNSTVSAVAFDSANKTFSFSVNGASGTSGYIKFYIAKSLLADATGLSVHLDGEELPYTIESQGDSWLVSFTYHHSSHRVDIQLGAEKLQVDDGLFGYLVLAALVAPLVIAGLVVLLVFRTKKAKT